MSILGTAAFAAGIVGAGSAVSGGVKMAEANYDMKALEKRHNQNKSKFRKQNITATGYMDKLGNLELEVLSSFQDFSDLIEKIHNKPQFDDCIIVGGNIIPPFNSEMTKVSVGAKVLQGGIEGAAVGTAGGFAAAGVTYAAVMACGTASTGTAIGSLSGAAATNATLAALGGGSVAAGGGGVALGTQVLGAFSLGVGILIGGVIFNVLASSVSDDVEQAKKQVDSAENTINKICRYLRELSRYALQYSTSIRKVYDVYREHLEKMKEIIINNDVTDWNDFTPDEKIITENTSYLVGLLYNMCKVNIVIQSEQSDGINTVNIDDIKQSMENSNEFLKLKNFA